MTQITKYSKILKFKDSHGTIIGIIVLLCIGFAIAQLGNYFIDHHSFPGCIIVGSEDSGKTLVIELDDELTLGTDSACKAAGKLIYKICLQGYRVRVINWTITETIGLERAYWLARGY